MTDTHLMNALESVWNIIATAPTPSMTVVVLLVSILISAFLLRLIIRRHRIRMARTKIPFVIGGWGTRGKSGTERKKAALFEGLGYNVVGKTTGCEAMMIHARPGQEGVELPIYRPGDKATIWEQGNVLLWASKLNTQVFLWECMALGSDYASTLQHDWMNDDLSTLSNTFVDHENVQGPTGMDVASSLTSFIPYDGELFTAEELMTPLIREIGRNRGTHVYDLSWFESDLIGDDVLKQFPYTVHPRNLGMVLKMARHLGIDDNVALKEIARNIIPDLGSFKCYRTRFQSRYLEFWNGMSANDRISTMSNWEKAGFHHVKPNSGTWTVTVINNRDDRIIRSREFSEIVVNDTPAHIHVLIGTNLNGLQGYLIEAVKEYAHGKNLVGTNGSQPGDTTALLERLKSNALQVFNRLKADAVSLNAITLKCQKMLDTADQTKAIESMLQSLIDQNITDQRTIVTRLTELNLKTDYPEAIAAQLVRDLKDYRLISTFMEFLQRELTTNAKNYSPTMINDRYRNTIIEIFKNRIVKLHNPYLSGDQVISQIVSHTPPHFTIKMMGMQNIKGTGLDFAYRWVSLDKIQSAVTRLDSDNTEDRRKALDFLIDYDDYGLLDAQLAINALKYYRKQVVRELPDIIPQLDDAISKIQRQYEIRTTKINAENRYKGFQRFVLWVIEQLREAGDSKRRQKQIKQILKDLFAQRISHVKAKKVLHDIKKRQEGGWMLK